MCVSPSRSVTQPRRADRGRWPPVTGDQSVVTGRPTGSLSPSQAVSGAGRHRVRVTAGHWQRTTIHTFSCTTPKLEMAAAREQAASVMPWMQQAVCRPENFTPAQERLADGGSGLPAQCCPRTVRRDVDSARDADDRIRRMMGDGSDSGLAARDAQSPFLQPRDEVGPGPASASDRRSNSARRCQRFTQCLQLVCIRFTLQKSGLWLVYIWFV
jgi:hypothetical protein